MEVDIALLLRCYLIKTINCLFRPNFYTMQEVINSIKVIKSHSVGGTS